MTQTVPASIAVDSPFQDLLSASCGSEMQPGTLVADPFEVLGLRSEPWDGPRGGRIRAGADAESGADAAADLLDLLNDEFARVVRDPHQLIGPADWPAPAPVDRIEAPTLAQLSAQGRAYPLVGEILEPRENVEAVIGRFDPIGEVDLFRAAAPDDVLTLFAPELRDDLSRGLPSLTRREHHAVSLDSHLRMGRVLAGPRDDPASPLGDPAKTVGQPS